MGASTERTLGRTTQLMEALANNVLNFGIEISNSFTHTIGYELRPPILAMPFCHVLVTRFQPFPL